MTESTTLRRGEPDDAPDKMPDKRGKSSLVAKPLPAERSRPDKHSAITKAAAETFLAEGFDRASLDQIAHRAGVSKQTIYSHFADKEALFKAICIELTEKLMVPLRKPDLKSASLRLMLIRLGQDTLAMMLHPASLDLHRLVLGAAARFPDMGRTAYEAGALRILDDLSALLMQRSQIGDGFSHPLAPGPARVLAEQFMGMLCGFHQVRALLGAPPLPPAERRAYVEASVDLLLRVA